MHILKGDVVRLKSNPNLEYVVYYKGYPMKGYHDIFLISTTQVLHGGKHWYVKFCYHELDRQPESPMVELVERKRYGRDEANAMSRLGPTIGIETYSKTRGRALSSARSVLGGMWRDEYDRIMYQ